VALIRELKQLERDLTQLGALGKDLDPAECASGICGVISYRSPADCTRRSQLHTGA
jgi:hypothetical protein